MVDFSTKKSIQENNASLVAIFHTKNTRFSECDVILPTNTHCTRLRRCRLHTRPSRCTPSSQRYSVCLCSGTVPGRNVSPLRNSRVHRCYQRNQTGRRSARIYLYTSPSRSGTRRTHIGSRLEDGNIIII